MSPSRVGRHMTAHNAPLTAHPTGASCSTSHLSEEQQAPPLRQVCPLQGWAAAHAPDGVHLADLLTRHHATLFLRPVTLLPGCPLSCW